MRDLSYQEAIERREVEAADRLHSVSCELAERVGVPSPPRDLFVDHDTAMQVANDLLTRALYRLNPNKTDEPDSEGR